MSGRPDERAAPAGDETVLLLQRILHALERLAEATDAVAAKLDRANETLERLNRSQWS